MDERQLVERSGEQSFPSESAEKQAGPRYILCFEKAEEDARMFSVGAEEVDCQFVIWASDPLLVHEMARTHNLQMIVLGCTRTEDYVVKILQGLREIVALQYIPIVVFSHYASEAEIRQAFTLGADRFFLKPPIKEEYIACAMAIASQESNLDVPTMQYEKFPDEFEDDLLDP